MNELQMLDSTRKEKTIVCSNPKCDRSFSDPIKLTVIQENNKPKTFAACPFCFYQITAHAPKKKKPKKAKIKPTKSQDSVADKIPAPAEKPASCTQSFGYLSNRPKDSPIPDECLICQEITKCMLASAQQGEE